MSDQRKKTLAIYLGFIGFVFYFLNGNFIEPEKRKVSQIRDELDKAEAKLSSQTRAKNRMEEEARENEELASRIEAYFKQFPSPKSSPGGRPGRGRKSTKTFDGLSLSAAISAAAQDVTLETVSPLSATDFWYRATDVPEVNLQDELDSIQPTSARFTLPEGEEELPNTLLVTRLDLKYKVAGNFAKFVAFLMRLPYNDIYLEATRFDSYAASPNTDIVEGEVTISSLDLSSGLVKYKK